jgi:hypothetical protein
MRKKEMLFFAILILIFYVSLVETNQQDYLSLKKGKNYVAFNNTQDFYVNHLVDFNPEIEVVSYKEDNYSKGYVNSLGGLGENFLIKKDIEYEIILKEDKRLILPQ